MGASRYQARYLSCLIGYDCPFIYFGTANVMISDDGKQPILMDFGSAIPARISVSNRSIALTEQDRAAEHSTMPYRAPELFDVRSLYLRR